MVLTRATRTALDHHIDLFRAGLVARYGFSPAEPEIGTLRY